MRHLLRHDHTRQALLVVILLQHLDLGLFDNVGSPERPSNDTNFTSSVCTMDLGQKDLAPVFTSCSKDRKPIESSFQSKPQSGAASTAEGVHIESLDASLTEERAAPQQRRRWIVLWKEAGPTNGACQEAEAKDAGRFDGVCLARYSKVVDGFAVEFTDSELHAFLEAYRGKVDSVHEDTEVSVFEMEDPAPWGLDRLDQRSLPLNQDYDYYNLGTGVNVYIVDTGIRVSHQEFRYGDGSAGQRAAEVYTSLQSGATGQDCNGHGTHVAAAVAGLTFGVAKNASLLAVRSLECMGNGTVSQVIQGLDWVRQHYAPPAVVVMALGGDSQYALDMAVRNLALAGVPVVVAAGNEDTDACAKSPAREPLAITVAASTPEDARLWISPGVGSNYGRCVDVWAPGSDILSASHRSDRATEYRSGTSQAVPFVAGTAALYLQNASEATPEDVVGVLTASGVWGAVHESAESGPFNANVLDGTPAILDNIDTFDALHAVPSMITVAGGSAGFGPRAINITLTQAPTEPVLVHVNISDSTRGAAFPPTLRSTPQDWTHPKVIWIDVGTLAWLSTDSDEFYVDMALESRDSRYDGNRPRIRVKDNKGDTLEYPKVIQSLPFWDTANTYFFNDDYTVTCNGQYTDQSGGKDVVYFFAPQQSARVIISLCASSAFSDAFDTKLYVLADLLAPKEGAVTPIACNDDFCGYQSQITMDVQAGVGYGIVVDGFAGKFGTYQITVSAAQGHIQGALPSGRYGQDGRLTLSRTLVLPIEQAPYTPSSFSGSNPSPPPPAPFSPGQTPPTDAVPAAGSAAAAGPGAAAGRPRDRMYNAAPSSPPPRTRPGPPVPPLSPFLSPRPATPLPSAAAPPRPANLSPGHGEDLDGSSRIGAGSNASIAIQGGSPAAGQVPAPQAAAPEQDDAGKSGHGQLAYTWSIPAVPPSLQNLWQPYQPQATAGSDMSAISPSLPGAAAPALEPVVAQRAASARAGGSSAAADIMPASIASQAEAPASAPAPAVSAAAVPFAEAAKQEAGSAGASLSHARLAGIIAGVCAAAVLVLGLAFLNLRRTRLLRQIDTDSESSGGLPVTVPPKLQPEQATPARLKHGTDVSRNPLAASATSTASHPARSVRTTPAAESCLTPCPPAMLQAVR
ncbi:hypothetical protein CVIRNUC_005706 [Coccomyxa viridis]|uniref:Peptidase S8/S53 domain-containing protein n=1 Tax=Coccomyxa viridis TaxID=1274662 RepID=A0AAV1I6V6_9CHLO|nr:hypothetical protein CVIRNUC_005706 [Coccomyxa viridis]